ncbi:MULTISPECIES: hypothetical protein [Vibrio]|uniref:hypothetical protein n=1 Tax=Vibrio TaxID=662 RepID=UPI000841B43D|nr:MULTISPECIES: hypothetical protein [Vibrio]ODM56973.1 hypothetical protein BC455_17935 [Vibrio harveyi]USD58682.1 hypothetical protein J4N44_27400 [Vibrio sp. SCSIO 43155]
MNESLYCGWKVEVKLSGFGVFPAYVRSANNKKGKFSVLHASGGMVVSRSDIVGILDKHRCKFDVVFEKAMSLRTH